MNEEVMNRALTAAKSNLDNYKTATPEQLRARVAELEAQLETERDKNNQRPQNDLAASGKGHRCADGVHGQDFLNIPTEFANSTTADTAD